MLVRLHDDLSFRGVLEDFFAIRTGVGSLQDDNPEPIIPLPLSAANCIPEPSQRLPDLGPLHTISRGDEGGYQSARVLRLGFRIQGYACRRRSYLHVAVVLVYPTTFCPSHWLQSILLSQHGSSCEVCAAVLLQQLAALARNVKGNPLGTLNLETRTLKPNTCACWHSGSSPKPTRNLQVRGLREE